MTSRVLCLFLGILACLTHAPAETPRFATGFLIYKSVPSDGPVYYNGLLYLSSSPLGILKEYDIGQAKPVRIENVLVVSEIKFGALFSADFTTDKHVDYCKGIMAQLAAATAQSPRIAKVAKAASDAIAAEIARYTAGEVRHGGRWISRAAYQAIADEADRQKNSAMAQERAREEEKREADRAKLAAEARLKAQREAESAKDRALKENLNFPYPSLGARLLCKSMDVFARDAVNQAVAGHFFSIPGITPDPDAIPMPRRPYVRLELRTDRQGSPSKMSMLCAFDKESRLVAVGIAFWLVTDSTRQTLLNKSEVQEVRSMLSKFDPYLFDLVPDLLATSRIGRSLRKLPLNADEFRIPFSRCSAMLNMNSDYADSTGQVHQLVSICIYPE